MLADYELYAHYAEHHGCFCNETENTDKLLRVKNTKIPEFDKPIVYKVNFENNLASVLRMC